MRYAEPEAIDEAVALLAASERARCLAGGATLVAMMNAGEVAPELLVSLHRIPALSGISESDGTLWIGAMTRHSTVAADPRLCGARAVVQSAARQLAHPVIRTMATIGGSIALADPATDLPGALVAAAAYIEITGPDGVRLVPVDQVFRGRHQTILQRGELITRIALPNGPPGAMGHHLRHTRVHADYPIVSISLVIAVEQSICTYARIAVGSCGPVPLHVDAAETRLVGSALSRADIAEAAEILVRSAEPIDDIRGSAEYRRMLIPRLLGRAISQAREAAHV